MVSPSNQKSALRKSKIRRVEFHLDRIAADNHQSIAPLIMRDAPRANRHSDYALVRRKAEAAQGGGTGGVLEARLRATNAATFRLALILWTGLPKRSAAFLLRQKPIQGFSSQKSLAEALPHLPPARNLNVGSP